MTRLSKFVEEKYPYWFVLGHSPDGNVWVCDGTNDVVNVERDVAEALVEDRNRVINLLVELAVALDLADHEKFTEIYYGGRNAGARSLANDQEDGPRSLGTNRD